MRTKKGATQKINNFHFYLSLFYYSFLLTLIYKKTGLHKMLIIHSFIKMCGVYFKIYSFVNIV